MEDIIFWRVIKDNLIVHECKTLKEAKDQLFILNADFAVEIEKGENKKVYTKSSLRRIK